MRDLSAIDPLTLSDADALAISDEVAIFAGRQGDEYREELDRRAGVILAHLGTPAGQQRRNTYDEVRARVQAARQMQINARRPREEPTPIPVRKERPAPSEAQETPL